MPACGGGKMCAPWKVGARPYRPRGGVASNLFCLLLRDTSPVTEGKRRCQGLRDPRPEGDALRLAVPHKGPLGRHFQECLESHSSHLEGERRLVVALMFGSR